jgi:hypothetical protein
MYVCTVAPSLSPGAQVVLQQMSNPVTHPNLHLPSSPCSLLVIFHSTPSHDYQP